MKILVTGENGQLGSELKKISHTNSNFEWVFTDRQSFNISDLENVNVYLDKCNPNIIINCAAYTAVDRAEDDFEFANIVNNEAISLITKWCNDNNCNLIHISTDYVYNGYSKTPYIEADETNPLNNYGKSKLLGDLACLKNNPSSIIIRTSWLYSSFGNNFLTKMILSQLFQTYLNLLFLLLFQQLFFVRRLNKKFHFYIEFQNLVLENLRLLGHEFQKNIQEFSRKILP